MYSLVCTMAQPSPSFSAGEEQPLEMKISSIVTQFEREERIFFHKVITKSAATGNIQGAWAYSLEIPFPFAQEYGEYFCFDVTFERQSCDRRWPIKLTLQEFKNGCGVQSRLFAYGKGGWKEFLIDNKIEVGDVLFFTLLKKSRFLVQTLEECLENVDRASHCPQFAVTVVRPSHDSPDQAENGQHESLSLEVPASFWDRHRDMLNGDELHLQGPKCKHYMMVKAVSTYHLEDEEEPKLSVRLERGWKAFFDANRLHLGDKLQFSLVEPKCFKVDLLAP